jgi:hypothetical protein
VSCSPYNFSSSHGAPIGNQKKPLSLVEQVTPQAEHIARFVQDTDEVMAFAGATGAFESEPFMARVHIQLAENIVTGNIVPALFMPWPLQGRYEYKKHPLAQVLFEFKLAPPLGLEPRTP